MDEGIEVLTRVWMEESVTHGGRFYAFEDVTLLPGPCNSRTPACGSVEEARPAARTASHGAGWFPY